MKGKISQSLWGWIAFIWMCVEIGQFIEERTRLGGNDLFWPFWICLSLVLLMGAHTVDLTKKSHEEN